MTDWLEQQVVEFRRLAGRRVSGWRATEMALRECGRSGAPEFEDPACPFLQLTVLHLCLDDGSLVCLGTYQDDDFWGLSISVAETPLAVGLDGIYRTRELDDLATGAVTDVVVRMGGLGNIQSVEMRFEGASPVVLIAGEVYEEHDDSLRICLDDESVLLFRSPMDVELVDWSRPPN